MSVRHIDGQTGVQRPMVTAGLVASLVAVFAIQVCFERGLRLVALGGISDAGPLRWHYWRLLTYGWLHASVPHLIMNSSLLAWVGRIVERRIGGGRLLSAYLAGVIGGGIAIAARAALLPRAGMSVGASAGVLATLSCGLVLLHHPAWSGCGQPPAVRRALWSIGFIVLAASVLQGVSLAGHLAGVLVGAVFGLLMPPPPAVSGPYSAQR